MRYTSQGSSSSSREISRSSSSSARRGRPLRLPPIPRRTAGASARLGFMLAGDILDGRFELERSVGIGGMGEVFRACDRATDSLVAVKLLHAGRLSDTARFEREARVLSELSHPGVVRYVAHGVAARGEPFLVMEWLEG